MLVRELHERSWRWLPKTTVIRHPLKDRWPHRESFKKANNHSLAPPQEKDKMTEIINNRRSPRRQKCNSRQQSKHNLSSLSLPPKIRRFLQRISASMANNKEQRQTARREQLRTATSSIQPSAQADQTINSNMTSISKPRRAI